MDENDSPEVPDWLIPSKAYDVLKWVGLIVLPALALGVSTIGPAWGLTGVDAIVTTLNTVGTVLGLIIGASAVKARI